MIKNSDIRALKFFLLFLNNFNIENFLEIYFILFWCERNEKSVQTKITRENLLRRQNG
jgi:hypothetical protein